MKHEADLGVKMTLPPWSPHLVHQQHLVHGFSLSSLLGGALRQGGWHKVLGNGQGYGLGRGSRRFQQPNEIWKSLLT